MENMTSSNEERGGWKSAIPFNSYSAIEYSKVKVEGKDYWRLATQGIADKIGIEFSMKIPKGNDEHSPHPWPTRVFDDIGNYFTEAPKDYDFIMLEVVETEELNDFGGGILVPEKQSDTGGIKVQEVVLVSKNDIERLNQDFNNEEEYMVVVRKILEETK